MEPTRNGKPFQHGTTTTTTTVLGRGRERRLGLGAADGRLDDDELHALPKRGPQVVRRWRRHEQVRAMIGQTLNG
jgi:hypothetical protein